MLFKTRRSVPPFRTAIHTPQRHTTSRSITMASTNGRSTPAEGRKLKILMLHGYTQSGRLFEIKTKALKKSLEKHFPAAPKPGHLQQYPGGIDLVYPTAPMKLEYSDIPGHDTDGPSDNLEACGWWKRRGDDEPYTYEGMEVGLEAIAKVLKEGGPFDGALGFSQGGAAAGMVAALLEDGRREAFEKHQAKGGMQYPDPFTNDSGYVEDAIHPPLKFAVSYSGFGASTHPLYHGFYEPKIRTPMLHFIGTVDTVVSEERSLRLVEACVDGKGKEGGVPRVVYHPGGHFLPSSGKQYVAALVAFIREVLGEQADGGMPGSGIATPRKEERVEDMELPF
ncbi:Esterase inpF [Fulvia fulva]|uniref:Esterase inpF n=1 Tax=Passalora fulva TaxID=5499 RepID=A0A9Q8PMJ7_PASFU|nr:Esterase inpF [Fulvia fulva]KAK4609291.1 Esterase inpF [Fulvia fulva]KAK4609966.1 Esterase inpF [Fulvia fulva]UJO25281.1 Esterase inpF [Fulvia fulva]WPV22498.1 Esterase inpF [Fulvia fulva]WPV37908.1 Esterase inpF [Fulvia fulva]